MNADGMLVRNGWTAAMPALGEIAPELNQETSNE